ncbi:MAG TPA: FliH/SctL family protein [Candidatus Omnitrophota bacterium]|nr:FliH/SctL family protein [Candidatus Omnitrophota bacterium]
MALIKKNRIQETGEIVIEQKPVEVIPRAPELEAVESSASPAYPPANYSPGMDIGEADSEARQIIERANHEARAIVEKAKQDGYEAGRAEADQKIKEALETLNQAVIERKKIVKDAEAEILRLALKVAEQIIRSEVSLHRDVSMNIVTEAINRISDREQVIVRANREDAEYIKHYKDRLSGILDGVKSFSVIEDSTIEPGGCIVETNLGYVDARISTKLKAIEEALEKVRTSEEQ